MRRKNIFVVGLDDFNRKRLEAIRNADAYAFHPLLDLKQVQGAQSFPIREWLAEAEDKLRAFDGPIDAILGFWDFPVSMMVPILRESFGLPGASLRSVVACEHKYWSRLEQARVVPEHVPRFQAVDPFADDALDRIEIEPPVWIKPIKAFASQLGFLANDDEEIRRALAAIRQGICRFGDPFDEVLSRVDLPEDVAGVTGRYVMVEEVLRGHQCTLSGYIHRGEVHGYGVIDSLNYPGTPCFARYQYPSTRISEAAQEHMVAIAGAVLRRVGFDNSAFNVEFFCDDERDHLDVLEVNTRISQSHADLYTKVDGASNHQVLVELALGYEPSFPRGQGRYMIAGKHHVRSFGGEVVTRVPHEDDFRRVAEELPDVEVLVQVEEGARIKDLPDQDSYSARLGVVYLGASDEDQLLRRWKRALEILRFEVDGQPVRAEKGSSK